MIYYKKSILFVGFVLVLALPQLSFSAIYEKGVYSLTPPQGWIKTENPEKGIDVS